MKKMLRVVEIMWLVVATVSIYEAYANWNVERDRAYMFLGFLGLAIFMFFLRRRSRLKFQNNQREDSAN